MSSFQSQDQQETITIPNVNNISNNEDSISQLSKLKNLSINNDNTHNGANININDDAKQIDQDQQDSDYESELIINENEIDYESEMNEALKIINKIALNEKEKIVNKIYDQYGDSIDVNTLNNAFKLLKQQILQQDSCLSSSSSSSAQIMNQQDEQEEEDSEQDEVDEEEEEEEDEIDGVYEEEQDEEIDIDEDEAEAEAEEEEVDSKYGEEISKEIEEAMQIASELGKQAQFELAQKYYESYYEINGVEASDEQIVSIFARMQRELMNEAQDEIFDYNDNNEINDNGDINNDIHDNIVNMNLELKQEWLNKAKATLDDDIQDSIYNELIDELRGNELPSQEEFENGLIMATQITFNDAIFDNHHNNDNDSDYNINDDHSALLNEQEDELEETLDHLQLLKLNVNDELWNQFLQAFSSEFGSYQELQEDDDNDSDYSPLQDEQQQQQQQGDEQDDDNDDDETFTQEDDIDAAAVIDVL